MAGDLARLEEAEAYAAAVEDFEAAATMGSHCDAKRDCRAAAQAELQVLEAECEAVVRSSFRHWVWRCWHMWLWRIALCAFSGLEPCTEWHKRTAGTIPPCFQHVVEAYMANRIKRALLGHRRALGTA